MSTSDDELPSYCYQGHDAHWEGDFSHWFFEHVEDGFNAEASFNYACGKITHVQNPQIEGSWTYDWFD